MYYKIIRISDINLQFTYHKITLTNKIFMRTQVNNVMYIGFDIEFGGHDVY